MKAKYVKHLKHHAQNLTIGNIYLIIGIEADSYRIICDENEPYLYSAKQFILVDSQMPDFWCVEKGEEGELYAYPEPWFNNYFFEDYFDYVIGKKEAFWEACWKYYGIKAGAKNSLDKSSEDL